MSKRNRTLATLKVKAGNVKIINSLFDFKSRRIIKLSISSFNYLGETIEVIVDLIVKGKNKECLKIIRGLNKFLTNEDITDEFGYLEITTIPATYEVIVNE